MATHDHIHLSKVIGGAPENAPDLKWKTLERIPIPTLLGSYERTMSGHFRHYTVVDGSGNPVRPIAYYYKVIVREEYGDAIESRLDKLINMLGEIVYLVDHKHADDGADHSSDIKTMYLAEIGEIVPISVGLIRYEVEITLEDASRM